MTPEEMREWASTHIDRNEGYDAIHILQYTLTAELDERLDTIITLLQAERDGGERAG